MFNELKQQVSSSLLEALEQHLEFYCSTMEPDSIFGYVIYPASGFVGFGVAVGVIPDDGDNLDAARPNVITWERLNDKYELFDQVSRLSDRLVRFIEDGENILGPEDQTDEESDQVIDATFREIILFVFDALSSRGYFERRVFIGDVLKGVQFADPSPRQTAFLMSISERVNSDYWHRRVLAEFQ